MKIIQLKQVYLKFLRGFTLVELVIVVSIVGVISAIGGTMIYEGVRAYYNARDYSDAYQQGRAAIERFAREVRDEFPTSITALNATNFTYTDRSGASVNWSQSGSQIVRQVNGGTNYAIVQNVSNNSLQFTYLQNDGSTAAVTAVTTFYVTISFTVSYSTTSGQTFTIPFTTTVYLRRPL